MSDKQQILLDYAKEHGGKISTKEANNLLRNYYYTNHQHYVSEILTRLVKSGMLLRITIGHYQINQAYRPARKREQPNNEQQQNLF